MSKNLMPQIAEMLGIELGEEFKVEGDKDFEQKTFYLTARGLKVKLDQCPEKEIPAMAVLDSLLFGDTEIIKMPWKPKVGENYWTFAMLDNDATSDKSTWSIGPSVWFAHPVDWALLDKGWVYRTEKAAEAALPAVATAMNVEYKI